MLGDRDFGLEVWRMHARIARVSDVAKWRVKKLVQKPRAMILIARPAKKDCVLLVAKCVGIVDENKMPILLEFKEDRVLR